MKKNNKKGFTLIELLVVVAIIGILASVGVVAYGGYTASAKKGASKANFNSVAKWTRNELQKCNIGEVKAMTKKLDCATNMSKADKVGEAIVASQTAVGSKMKNPYKSTENAVSASPLTTCSKTNRGKIGVKGTGSNIVITACTAEKEGTVTNLLTETIILE